MNVTLPWFVSQFNVDTEILAGFALHLNVTCNGCGSWGMFNVWISEAGGRKRCPKCGSYDTEKVGN